MARSFLAAMMVLGLVASTWAADSGTPDINAMAKIMEEAGKPTAEHQKLQPLEGNWTYTGKFWMDPNQPPVETTGTMQRRWVLGNRFLEEKVTGTGFDGKNNFEGMGVIGYDKNEQKYTSGWICNMGTGVSTSLGTADPSGKVFSFDREEYCPIRKQKVKAREELKIESNDKHVMTMYEIDGGKERKTMELIVTRQK